MSSGAKIHTLAAGERTPWMDFKPCSGGGLTFQGINAAGGIAALEVCNSHPTSERATPADVIVSETNDAASFIRSLYGPMPNYGRIANIGTGTVVVSFGSGYGMNGAAGQVGEVGFPRGTSGRSNEMPS